jgi:hypothetical protein
MVMAHFLDGLGNYYEGDNQGNDLEVTKRPSPMHQWIGEWIYAPSLKDYDIAIELELDRDAREAGYYDPLDRIPPIDRACSYAAYPNPYQAEAQTFVVRRAAVWAYAYQVQADVEAQLRTQPSIPELIAELPQRVIPE